MRSTRTRGYGTRRVASSAIVAAALLLPRHAFTQVPAGGDFQVNSYTTSSQAISDVAIGPDGASVVAWASVGQDGDQRGIFARRLDAAGQLLGEDFQVNTYTTGEQSFPRVAVSPTRDFAVAWSRWDEITGLYNARARRFGPAGDPLGPEMVLGAPDDGGTPAVAFDGGGDLILAWKASDADESGVFGRRFDRTGRPLGPAFQVNTYTTGAQFDPQVAAAADGRFVVVWGSMGQDGSSSGIFGRRFDSGGSPVGAELAVNTYTTGSESQPAVAMSPDGEFVVSWLIPAGDAKVVARWFDRDGRPAGAERLLAGADPGYQDSPTVASDGAGRFVVAWRGVLAFLADERAFARRIGSGGAFLGARFQANAATTSQLGFPAVASDGSGNLVVTWTMADDDTVGIWARRFGVLRPEALGVDTVPGEASDGNGVWEPGESVDLHPSWINLSGEPRTAGGALSELAGPPAVYLVEDGAGDYGTLDDGASRSCTDCYSISTAAPAGRPATHWDATVLESLTPQALGQQNRWRLHLGGSFSDVPRASPFYRFVETVLHRGVTAGCGGALYCPAVATLREQMAAMVLAAREGSAYRPPPCGTPVFPDVPATSPFCPFVEELARRGVVGGCGAGLFCPANPTTREQMAVFVLRTLEPALQPPACTTPVFADVPASSPFCRWIVELARRGVVSGCGGGNYCPQAAVTREQTAVFLTATFGLLLYGP